MLNLLKKRRSIRQYTAEKINKEQVKQIMKAALLSPSSRNKHSWEFVFVDDEELLQKLACSKQHGSSFLKQAALGIVVLGDIQITDIWVEDTSIATMNMHLMAASMNLGSCWIQIRERWHDDKQKAGDYIRNLLDIPERYEVLAILAIGHPAEEKSPYNEDELQYNKIHCNKFGIKYQL